MKHSGEKDRRRFAAFQSQQLGHRAIKYLAEVVGCCRRTIERGINELNKLPCEPAPGRVRRLGAGRKKRLHQSVN